MKTDRSAEKRRWTVAIGAGVVLTALAGALFRVPRAPVVPPAGPRPGIVLAPAESLEETALHDPAPLFEPTQWNSRPALPARDPGVAIASYPPAYRFPTAGLGLPLPNDVPAGLAAALATDSPGNQLLGLGRTGAEVPALAPRGAFVRVVAAGTGSPILALPLAGARPPEGVFWRPLEFLAEVDATGLVGPLVLSGPSNVDSVNAYFQEYLVRGFRVGDRLLPGFYHIWVGP
jgi:hypothetical protein